MAYLLYLDDKAGDHGNLCRMYDYLMSGSEQPEVEFLTQTIKESMS